LTTTPERFFYRLLMPHLYTNIRSSAKRGTEATAYLKNLMVVLGLATTLYAQNLRTQQGPLTPVEGESWLSHLHRSFEETAMGKTWRLGPPPEVPGETPASSASLHLDSRDRVILRGADLYRLNCEGCHGEFGLGAPPEIGSIVNPVRATSVPLVTQRMKSAGAEISRGQAAELARQSKTALLQRIHNGGQDMPSFSYLSDFEVSSLVAYLNQLAGVPNAATQQVAVPESHTRVGELIVKSTCHICHAATGPNPGPAELAGGAIPPLATLTTRSRPAGLIRKVTRGAPVAMGAPPLSFRGRMPVFFYLSESEAADVYEYLEAYPPSDATNPHTAALARDVQIASTRGLTLFQPGAPQPNAQPPQPMKTASALRTWLLCLSFGVFGLLGAGFVVTLREFRKLSTEAQIRRSLRTHHVPQAVPMAVAPPLLPANAERFCAPSADSRGAGLECELDHGRM